MEALGINPGFLLAQIINFLLLVLLMGALGYRPLLNMLEERKRKIAKGLEDARVAAEARQNAEAEAEKILEEKRAEAQKIIEDAIRRARELEEQIKQEAHSEAERIRAQAKLDAEAERNLILADLRGQVAMLAIAAAHRIIGEAMDERRQQELIADFFSKVPADVKELGKVDKVEVVSALPLTDEEKEQIRKEIQADEIEFKVDPSILGGLKIRAGDKVVDGSFANQLRELAIQLLSTE